MEEQTTAPAQACVELPETPEKLKSAGYQLIREIGEGANGKTYLGKNRRTGETVAIKALKFSDDLKNYELFEREAETLKQIQTPGVPKFFEYITDGQKFRDCWLVQEYIGGESLQELMDQGFHFRESEVLEIMLQTAGIISELQTRYSPPIIHRDIKPSNIMVEFKETYHTIKNVHLIDFGSVANPQRRSGSSTVAGTVGYMAPEQLMGDCTTQSDYYALGATALYLFTGVQPCDMPVKSTFQLDFENILKEKCPNVSDGMIQLLGKLLTKAENRPQNSAELLDLIANTSGNQIVKKIITNSSGNQISISRFTANLLRSSIIIIGALLGLLLFFAVYPGLVFGGPLLIIKFELSIVFFAISIIISIAVMAFARYIFEIFLMYINFIKSICKRFNGNSFNIGNITIYIKEKCNEDDIQWNRAKAIIMGISSSRNMIEYVFSANHKTFVGYAPLSDYPDIKLNQEIDISYHPRNPKRNAIDTES